MDDFLRSPLIVILSIVLLLAACASPIKKTSVRQTVQSADYEFIDRLLAQSSIGRRPRNVDVWVSLPDTVLFQAPYPSVVLLHSSWGLSSQEWYYAEEFRKLGIATLVIDSFTSRGVSKTSLDQSRVSSASMLQDAYAVLDYLESDSRFDSTRVAIMGFSKGGIVALYSALANVQKILSTRKLKFVAHIAYYPWCGLYLHNMQTTGAPILIQTGDKDIVTPVFKCKELIGQIAAEDSAMNIDIQKYSGARHAFDHPLLARIPFPISMNVQVPIDCKIVETRPGYFVETSTNMPVSFANIAQVLRDCSKYNGVAGYHRSSAQAALQKTREFLIDHLDINLPHDRI